MVGQEPTEAEWKRIKAELREAARHPIVYDEDCPRLTDAQLAEFRPVNGMTWEERALSMRSKQSEIRREVHCLIDLLPERVLLALKPLLELLSEDIEIDLTEVDRARVAARG
jgi:hypothetical protein